MTRPAEDTGNGDFPRVVVVDDEPDLRQMVVDYLGKHGFAVTGAADGRALDARLSSEPADVVLLDVNMPGEDGFAIARRVRANPALRPSPRIVMLTAACDIVDRVVGLELGADDYVTKPFDLRELRARIRAVLRRNDGSVERAAGAQADPRPELVAFGHLGLDLKARRLLHGDGREVLLTAMEFDLLHVFAQNPNRVLSRDRLLDLAHARDSEPFDRSIDIRITRIRRKIEIDPRRPAVIKTMRGAGYMYVPGGPRRVSE